jgi:hypothetical protein
MVYLERFRLVAVSQSTRLKILIRHMIDFEKREGDDDQ